MPQHHLAIKILTEFRGSSSFPVLVETTDGTKCIVKWRCTGEGPLANATDWIALQLARAVGILVPTPCLVEVTPHLIHYTTHGELKDTILRSVGVNLGIEYIERASPFQSQFTGEVDSQTKRLIFLFDVLFLNMDRTDRNPNMVVADGELYCIDFAAAMSLRMLMNGERYSESALLPLLRRHPFYDPSFDVGEFNCVINDGVVRESVDSIPNDWLSNHDAAKENIFVGVKKMLVESAQIIERRLAVLKTLPFESDEEYKKRTARNRIAFEEATGKKL
jgi:hypothetical protein